MSRKYNRFWTVKYPDGFLSAFDCLALSAPDARKKAVKRWGKTWAKLRKEGFTCVRVIFKELRGAE